MARNLNAPAPLHRPGAWHTEGEFRMQAQRSRLVDGIHVASGYGLKVYVERGHLVVHEGVGRRRETRRCNRATSGLKRLVVIGHSGFVTLEALRWIRDVGAAFVQLDADGSLISLSGYQGTDAPALRRAQALARTSVVGLDLARSILCEKIRGQAAVASQLGGTSSHAIEKALAEAEAANAIATLVGAEASAAEAYWEAWAEVPVPFGKRDRERAPDHWLRFGQRHSPLSRSPRLAANPANAILNYLYALLEAETTLACLALGLDPGLGIFHEDRRSRASLALDLLEAARPTVDAYLLGLLSHRTLRARDFAETRRGTCRIGERLARELASTSASWRSHVAPIVERSAAAIGASAGITSATPLTQTNRRAGLRARGMKTAASHAAAPRLPHSCRKCGEYLADAGRRHCDECLRDQTVEAGARGRPAAEKVLRQLRGEGRDPAHGGEAARRRGQKNASHQQAVADWNKGNDRPDSTVFVGEILPGLRRVGIGEIVAATGLSGHYCSLIRLGKRIPHARHWPALDALARSHL